MGYLTEMDAPFPTTKSLALFFHVNELKDNTDNRFHGFVRFKGCNTNQSKAGCFFFFHLSLLFESKNHLEHFCLKV